MGREECHLFKFELSIFRSFEKARIVPRFIDMHLLIAVFAQSVEFIF